jgi:small GTP-binding protein
MASGKKCGIVGLPNVGKSTLFNFVMKEEVAEVANYPFCTIDPNIKKRDVKDKRLEVLAKKKKSEKIIYSELEIYDIAGLVAGASEGEGLGNKFLGNILEVDLIIHVVRLFDNEDMILNHIDPVEDFKLVETELFLWDMKRVEDMIQKNKKNPTELKILNDILECLKNEKYPNKTHIPLITNKPIIILGNGDNPILVEKMTQFAKERNLPFFYFDFHKGNDDNFDALILEAYKTLNLISFFTCGPKEARSWTVKKGTNYKDAAKEIHNDISNGFICAHTIPWSEYDDKPTIMKKAIDIVEDGVVVLFKHH